MLFLFRLFLSLIQSFVWLFFYLCKDVKPEKKSEITKFFLYGALIVFPVLFIEKGIFWTMGKISLSFLPHSFWMIFFFGVITIILVALIEEISKYLIIRQKLLKNPEFDEPVDAVIYMIIAALGFAAMENILLFFNQTDLKIFSITALGLLRFFGAVFLHTLCSGIIGYFLALSIFELKKKKGLIFKGIFIAVFFHGLFNFSLFFVEKINSQEIQILGYLIRAAILIGLSLFLANGIENLKKIKSVCKI